MKIKEVEVFNTIFQVEGNVLPSPDDTVYGKVSNDGKTLSIIVDRPVPVNYVRRIVVSFMIIDLTNKTYINQDLGIGLIRTYTPGDTFDVDLTPVLTIPQTYSETINATEVQLEPLTYEANIERSWGLQTLIYPHKLHVTGQPLFPESTDAWYQVSILDIPIWNGVNEYKAGDIVYYDDVDLGGYMKAAVDNVTEDPINPDEIWFGPTEDDWKLYGVSLNRATNWDATLRVLSDLLITRNIKHKYIFECIKAVSFNPVDNIAAEKTLNMIVALREVAVAYLESGDPLKALAAIARVPNEYQALLKADSSNEIPKTYEL